MSHHWYVNGLEFEVLSIHQDKPKTMVHLNHVSNGVTYEAHGWTRWDGKDGKDGKDEWSNGKGVLIAMKRARRKIEKRLKWEVGVSQRAIDASAAREQARKDAARQWSSKAALIRLHRDGGTVEL